MTKSQSPPNRLAREKSPYLLQHAHNPVDWYPWGAEAFKAAREQDKPIFLSIGYSTCHWCHVMERESFENEAIAARLNRDFICVKVDREEHPDVDALYMQAVIGMTGQGGWPLSVFLSPEQKPFYGGTYFPPESRHGLIGFPEVLQGISDAWSGQRAELLESAEQLTVWLRDQRASGGEREIDESATARAVEAAWKAFDAEHGGFGPAPKFPRPHLLSFLLKAWGRSGMEQPLAMTTKTLDRLWQGGIHDQIGGGFHRYSTDGHWLVPHFEKMLYDQALLLKAYIEAFQATGRPEYARVARSTAEYVLRDLADPDGGFYAAEDADSEGREGTFYLWDVAEMRAALGPESALVEAYYGATEAGNFEGRNILYVWLDPRTFAEKMRVDPEDWARRLARANEILLERRSRRARPHRDEKILTSWNGLMIGALALASRALDEPRYADRARAAAERLLRDAAAGGGLLRRISGGEARYPGTLEDYAFLAWGLLELYQASADETLLETAWRLAGALDARFRDPAGGWFLRDSAEEPLIAAVKDAYDGAVPSGNSIACEVFLRLGIITGEESWTRRATEALRCFAGAASAHPLGFPQLLQSADWLRGPVSEIVITGEDTERTRRFRRILAGYYFPAAVILHRDPGRPSRLLDAGAPWRGMVSPGEPAVTICHGRSCRQPVKTEEDLVGALENIAGRA